MHKKNESRSRCSHSARSSSPPSSWTLWSDTTCCSSSVSDSRISQKRKSALKSSLISATCPSRSSSRWRLRFPFPPPQLLQQQEKKQIQLKCRILSSSNNSSNCSSNSRHSYSSNRLNLSNSNSNPSSNNNNNNSSSSNSRPRRISFKCLNNNSRKQQHNKHPLTQAQLLQLLRSRAPTTATITITWVAITLLSRAYANASSKRRRPVAFRRWFTCVVRTTWSFPKTSVGCTLAASPFCRRFYRAATKLFQRNTAQTCAKWYSPMLVTPTSQNPSTSSKRSSTHDSTQTKDNPLKLCGTSSSVKLLCTCFSCWKTLCR